jgi:ABC-type nickel/cobalt efflux system permease component RcnA
MQNKSIPDIEAAVVVAMVITLLLRLFEASLSMQQINLKVTSSDLKVILAKFSITRGIEREKKWLLTYSPTYTDIEILATSVELSYVD